MAQLGEARRGDRSLGGYRMAKDTLHWSGKGMKTSESLSPPVSVLQTHTLKPRYLLCRTYLL